MLVGLDEQAVFGQVANERVALGKGEMGLDLPLVDEVLHLTQAPSSHRQGAGTGVVEGLEGMVVQEPGQSDEAAHGNGTVTFHQTTSPLTTRPAEFFAALLPVTDLLLQGALPAGHAQRIGKSPRLLSAMKGDLLEP